MDLLGDIGKRARLLLKKFRVDEKGMRNAGNCGTCASGYGFIAERGVINRMFRQLFDAGRTCFWSLGSRGNSLLR